jgi:hypothetical protein
MKTRRSIVGQVANRLPTCGRLAIGLPPRPTYFQQIAVAFDRAAAFQRRSPRPRRAVLNRRQPGDRFTQNKGFIGAVAGEAAFFNLRAGLAKITGGSFSTPSSAG